MRFVAFLFAALSFAIAPVAADERITAYNSEILVHLDSSLTVTETVTVNVEGKEIRRGIIRAYPTHYQTERGDTVTVSFAMQSVMRDGQVERYVTSRVANGVEVRIGRENVMLSHGLHTYVITYKVDYLLGHFDTTDELYYNVMGLDTPYVVEKASATIRLPAGARPGRMDVWTGAGRMREKGATIAEIEPSLIAIKSLGPLRKYEGITIAVEWPKGYVSRPTFVDYFFRWLFANAPAWIGIGGVVAMFFFLMAVWRMWGKDPPRGTIVPLFEPPDDLDPAAARYIHQMGYDNRAFAAAIVDMGVKGTLKIDETTGVDKIFSLTKTGKNTDALSMVEWVAYEKLFQDGDLLKMEGDSWKTIKAAKDAMLNELRYRHRGKTFNANQGPVGASLVIPALAGLGVWATGGDNPSTAIGFTVLIFGAVILLVTFSYLLKAPTREGQAKRDRLDGFRMFLDTAEKERWEILHPPQMTPQLFEKYLPYALALGVEHTWSQTFEREMRVAYPGETYTYQPDWYSGRMFTGIGADALSHSISNSVASGIAASLNPPGSGSAFGGSGFSFGGGGFSGGGGGGGGIRGW